ARLSEQRVGILWPIRTAAINPVYNATRLTQILQIIFAQQARYVLSQFNWDRIEAGKAPDLTAWIQITANAAKPLLLHWWQHGLRQSQARIATLVADSKKARKSNRKGVIKGERVLLRAVEAGTAYNVHN